MKVVRIGDRLVGEGQPCFLVAEIGINHNGDLDLAAGMIDAAAAAGADAVKFQNYRTENMVIDRRQTYQYVSQGQTVTEAQYDMFKRCELKPGQLRALCEHARSKSILCFSTPMDEAGVRECVEAGCTALKNGSDCLVHLPLIESMARTGLTTMLSTGMSVAADIDDAVRAFRASGGTSLLLLHCTSTYPTPPAEVHLRKLSSLATAFGCPAGFSDHTTGIWAALGAVALGAVCIEKHFTKNRALPGPDQAFSSTPAEFGELVRGVRALEAGLGTTLLGPAAAEADARQQYRLSCAAKTALPAGHRLAADDIIFLRPGTGLAPKHQDWLVGMRLTRKVEAGQVLAHEDFS